MKNIIISMLSLILAFSFSGCGKESHEAVANPWTDWSSIAEAEDTAGFAFGVPEAVQDSYFADSFRTMSGDTPIIEVSYTDDVTGQTVIIRKAPGEGQDLSGIYDHNYIRTREWWHGEQITYYRQDDSKSEMCSLKIVIFDDGYSWSVYAPKGFWGASSYDFLVAIFEQ